MKAPGWYDIVWENRALGKEPFKQDIYNVERGNATTRLVDV